MGEVIDLGDDQVARAVGQVGDYRVGEHGAGRHAMTVILLLLPRSRVKEAYLVHNLYYRLKVAEIAPVLSQFTGTVWKNSNPSSS